MKTTISIILTILGGSFVTQDFTRINFSLISQPNFNLTLDEEEALMALSKDERTIWYNKKTLKEVYETSGEIYKLGYNVAGNLDRTGTANNEKPWLHTGGLDNCGKDVRVERMLWIPPKTKIKLKREYYKIRGGRRNGLPYNRIAGDYPDGTVSAEFMYEGDRLFEARMRKKIEDGDWQTRQFEWGKKPKGYVAVTNCVDCHDDIGKHSFVLDAQRDWYGTVRGLEVGGPIHWHPWKTQGVGGSGRKMRLREDVKSFVEFQR